MVVGASLCNFVLENQDHENLVIWGALEEIQKVGLLPKVLGNLVLEIRA